ncbi:MAG TPA: hypothetical protein VF199_12505 [Bacillales bacterium]
MNSGSFEWIKCKRKNGPEFLKLVYYSPDANGYVEVGRFNISNSEFVQNDWDLDDIKREIS